MVDTALELTPPERIFVVVGHQAEQVRKALDAPRRPVHRADGAEGHGHALMVGREALLGAGGLLMVLYGDAR